MSHADDRWFLAIRCAGGLLTSV